MSQILYGYDYYYGVANFDSKPIIHSEYKDLFSDFMWKIHHNYNVYVT